MTLDARILEGRELDAVVRRVNAVEDVYSFIPQTTVVTAQPLPFYPSAQLLCVRSQAWRAHEDPLWFVDIAGRDLINLDGSADALNDVNAATPPVLTAATAALYVKYQLYFTMAGDSRAYLIDSLDDDSFAPLTTAARGHFFAPLVRPMDGGFGVTALVFENGAFTRSDFRVSADGRVDTAAQTPLFAPGRDLRSVRFGF